MEFLTSNSEGSTRRVRTTIFEPISGQTMASWPTCKVSISSSRWVLQLSFLFHPISSSIEEVILIWILPSFRRVRWLSRPFPAKPRGVRRLARYHSLRIFENYNFRFCFTWFRRVLVKLWTFKGGVVFRPNFRPSPPLNPATHQPRPFGPEPRPNPLGPWARKTKPSPFLSF